MQETSRQFEQALLSIDRLAVRRMADAARSEMKPMEIVDRLVMPALIRIGDRWERGDVSLAQVYMSGRICEELVEGLLPPDDTRDGNQPPMAIAVLDDYHLLGKRIVYALLRANGFHVKDYGRTTVSDTITRVRDDEIRVLLLSTLMLNSALRVREVVTALKRANLDVKVVVGGAPFRFDAGLWREVGADAMGYSASDAPGIVRNITGDLS
ncbi:MAG: cobalamin-binding protein [Deltaproteobacteria bacterium]|nr:cobalamin-binding protein [Deltaproteobacteria bacterium]